MSKFQVDPTVNWTPYLNSPLKFFPPDFNLYGNAIVMFLGDIAKFRLLEIVLPEVLG